MQDQILLKIRCGQGRHRSVSLALASAAYLHCMGLPVYIYFRGLDHERYYQTRGPCGCPLRCTRGRAVGSNEVPLNAFVCAIVTRLHAAVVDVAQTQPSA